MAGTVGDDAERAPSTGEAYAPGVRVAGRYQIVRFLAAGGMGEVYEASDLLVGGAVALKTLRADRSGAARAIERLRREVALARKITHPNVCRMHDVGDHEGRVFLTMELIRGATLADRIRRGPVANHELAAIADQLIAGLAAAHAAGVVHRDLKPGNVILAGDRAVITDFGLARSASADDDVALTSEAALLGTPGYLAPELVEGRAATAASDIYALGIVLYELATGELPFREDTAMATATARLHKDPPPVTARRGDLDRRWARAIMRCLARDPVRRFARVEDVGRETPQRRRRWPALVLAGGLGVGALATWRVLDDPPATRAAERAWPSRLRPASAKAAVHHDEAQRALASDDRTAARELLEQAVAAAPDDAIAQAALADLLDELGFAERARDAITRARAQADRLAPEPRAFVELVGAAIDGDATDAVAAAARLADLVPAERSYRLRLAAAQLAADDPAAADAALAALGAPRSDAELIRVELVRARISLATGDTAGMLAAANAAAARAHDVGRAHDEGEALTLVGAAAWLGGDAVMAAQAYQRAIGLGDSGVELRARTELIELELTLDRMGDVAEHYRELAALVRTLGDRGRLVAILLDGAGFLVEVGRLDEAIADLREAREVATALDAEVDLGWADSGEAFLALQQGRLADVAVHAERAYQTGARRAVTGLRGNAFHNWTEALLELDDATALTRARGLRGESVERLIDAFAALREGEHDRAERIARTLANLRTGEGRFAEGVIAVVELRRGKLEDAGLRLDRLAEVAVGDGASFYARDRLVRAQAELAARRGELPRALALLDDHAARCAAVGLRYCEILAAGLAAQLSGSRERADAVIARAEPLGFHRLVRELRQ